MKITFEIEVNNEFHFTDFKRKILDLLDFDPAVVSYDYNTDEENDHMIAPD